MGIQVYSEQQIDITPDLNDFFTGHIFKIMSGDDMKKCYFDEDGSDIYKLLKDFSEDDFIEFSKDITKRLYDIMNSNLAIPSADLASYIIQSAQCHVSCHFKDELQRELCSYDAVGGNWQCK